MMPVMALVGTLAVIWLGESTVKVEALRLPNWTTDAPVKLVPVRTTLVPVRPLAGEKPVITGGAKKN